MSFGTDVSDLSQLNPEFSVRIVVCDHYLTKPIPGIDVIYSEFRGSDIKQVPVLRIFGPTSEGHKACLHIHGVFPYFYIPCPNQNPEPQYLYQIAASLDKALNIALKQASSASQHVYKITLVKGLPFYGYHDKEHLYLKVFLYSPGLIKQAVELCSNGAILGQPFQPHEAHLNFTLQFFIDFNLFGMSNIDLQTVKYRKSGIFPCSNDPLESPNEVLKPESSCFYEVDCVASHIINRQRIGKGDGIENPGLEEVWQQEIERRKQLNMSVASKSLSQGRITAEQSESHYKFEQMFLIKMSNSVEKPVDPDQGVKKVPEADYPAESLEGSHLFNAMDVSMHLPDVTLSPSMNETLRSDFDQTLVNMDDTIVDESLALNCSLRYSQVMLNSEDLDLVDILQDMDEKYVEEDSIMGTPATEESDELSVDGDEYSQIYMENTILLSPGQSKNDTQTEDSPTWNDSFWNGVNIPQLDGTFDDDHVKKVRKRKMRSLKLGLSRPKAKKKDIVKSEEGTNDLNTSEVDEVNVSRETIEDMSKLNLKSASMYEPKSTKQHSVHELCDNAKDKIESPSIFDLVDKVTKLNKTTTLQQEKGEICDIENNHNSTDVSCKIKNISNLFIERGVDVEPANDNKHSIEALEQSPSILDLVDKVTKNNEDLMLNAADIYDIQNDFKPTAGPSTTNHVKDFKSLSDINSDSSLDENNTGIMSFYTSKVFNLSLETDTMVENKLIESHEIKVQIENDDLPEVRDHDEADKIKLDQYKTVDNSLKVITPKIKPPTGSYVATTLEQYKIPKVSYPEPFYSDYKDVGAKVEIGPIVLKLNSKLSRDQKPFENVTDTSLEEWRNLMFMETNVMYDDSAKPEALRTLLAGNKTCVLEAIKRPPTSKEVSNWIEERANSTTSESKIDNNASKNIDDLDNSQALGLNEDVINCSISLESDEKEKTSLDNTMQVTMQRDGSFLCFRNNNMQMETSPNEANTVEVNFITLMLLEVHTRVRGDLVPDPALDAIQAIFVTVVNDSPPHHFLPQKINKIIVVDDTTAPKYLDRCVTESVTYVANENEIIEEVVQLVRKHDPDIMCGYEIEMNSWGYFLERAQILGFEIVKEISRITEKYRQKRWRSDEKDFEGKIIGRVVFNVWRLLRHELALSSYSFENCMYEVLKERVPKYSYAQLAEWWENESRIMRWIPCEYYIARLSGTVRMLEKLDIINRTSELARLFGLQWWEVLSRGSQFRVESLMLRAARPLNLIALSPTVKQRAAMRAPECLPLIFEPESRYYTDPMIILDFQSLYPSMMIAYNYCFSTCIGRVQNINGDAAYEFGAWRLRIPRSKLEALVKNGLVHWSPVGVGFVSPSVRRGVLPALLRRILAARQAVKKTMKLHTDEAVKKAMHSRQLGLKLIANVTYGYTAANFSGRMPCVEVGDSVVAKGRETLERAIKLVRNNSKWNVKVVYGDTDSMFVVAPGATRAEAFHIGQQIADAVTADNPSPVALKLEKVYQPCILQTKKRYVGYMYETPEQEKPVFEAKGIETVRRDGCPAGVKLLRSSLCELFESGDMSRVKRTVCSLLSRLASGALPVHELFFTREYHGPAGYARLTAPPNEIALRLSSRDVRARPRAGERVAWAVCAGAPGTPLVRLARSPRELARSPAPPAPHLAYYATRALLPPLHRCLSLRGARVLDWWNELGYGRECQQKEVRGGIARYMARERCVSCGARGVRGTALCPGCAGEGERAAAVAAIAARGSAAGHHLNYCERICASCCGHDQYSSCENTECPVLWRRITARHKLQQMHDVVANLPRQLAKETFDF